jgi:2-oxo-4-hydroxy-4-carboxy-5-ureidoimidazoline decarboxylase
MAGAPLLDVLLGRAAPSGDEQVALRACLDSSLWVDAVLQGVPYPHADALLEAADGAARALPREAVLAAVRAHPRIGERAAGDGAAAWMSRAEQSGLATDGPTRARLAEATAAYEARFGHGFVIRAAGMSASQVLASLEQRLEHDPAVELAVTADQVRRVAVLRLEAQLAGDVPPSPPSGPAAAVRGSAAR